MENSSKTFRDNLSLQIKEKLRERTTQLEQAEMSVFSDKLKKMMKSEIMENFKEQIGDIQKTPGYDRARQAHLEVNRAKRNLNKANLEKEILLQEYMDKLSKADEKILQSKKLYEEAEIKYRGDIQNHTTYIGEVVNENDIITDEVDYLDDNEISNDIDTTKKKQKTELDTNKTADQNEIIGDKTEKDNFDTEESKEYSSNTKEIEENNFKSEEKLSNEDNFSGIKPELFGNEEAIKKELKKYVSIEKCIDKTGCHGRNICINIPKAGKEFPGYKFECFVSDEKFKSIDGLSNIRGRFIYRDDIHRLLDAINSYMNVYGITKDKFGYNRDMLGEIDNCVGMDCFKYITGLDSFYWLGWDVIEYKLNCTGKKPIFRNKNKRSHLLLLPSK